MARAFAQRNFGIGAVVDSTAGDFRLFRGSFSSPGDLFATLTWNRTYRTSVDFLRDLDLHVYDFASSALRGESISLRQNVEQVGVSHVAETLVIKVRAEDGGRGFNEPFAVALSDPGFAPMKGPVAGISCAVPNSVPVGSNVTVNCTVSNSGDAVLITPALYSSVAGATPADAGSLNSVNPGASAFRSFAITAPSTGSSFSIGIATGAVVYGEVFSAVTNLSITLTGGATERPVISSNGVVNGASSSAGLSPSQWVTIRGANLAPVTRVLGFVGGRYPTSSDGVSITVDGKPAFLYYLSPTQINFVSPDIERTGPVPVVVTNNGTVSETTLVIAQTTSPAAFLWPGGYVVATDPNYQYKIRPGTFAGVNTTAAQAGEVIIFWVTGLGSTNPAIAAGAEVPGTQIRSVTSPIEVRIAGIPAEIFGAALAPGNASLYQIALRVPPLSAGDHNVTITAAGNTSPAALLTVR